MNLNVAAVASAVPITVVDSDLCVKVAVVGVMLRQMGAHFNVAVGCESKCSCFCAII
jgi:hypothetical protein